jgi:hypothetical protein
MSRRRKLVSLDLLRAFDRALSDERACRNVALEVLHVAAAKTPSRRVALLRALARRLSQNAS